MADSAFFENSGSKTLEELAACAGADLPESSDPAFSVSDVAPLDKAESHHISFLDNVKYKEDFLITKAGACIVSPQMAEFAPDGVHLLISKTPYKAYALIAQAFYPDTLPETNVSPAAHVDETADIGEGCLIEPGAVVLAGAKIGKGSWIEANAVIGRNVEIGQKCRIGANATVSHAVIGDATRLYPGVRVGQDGFGFAIDPAGHVKVPQLGRVIIGSHVEIGANTTIDRGAGPDTTIGDGTWIDNLVQIAHNVKIGRGCVLIAQSGVAGSTEFEDFAVLAAQSGVAGHLKVGMGAQIGAQSGVMKNIPAGEKVIGSPAVPAKDFMRQVATLKRLTSKAKTA